MHCKFCDSAHKNLVIEGYEYWTLKLHRNQVYLGRCFVVLNRHVEDFFNISKDEANELFDISKNTRDALNKIFKPDLFNYGSFGNFIPHVHLHIIPRYSKPVVFDKKEFVDKNWGDFYYPYDKKYETPDDTLNNMVGELKEEIRKSKKYIVK